MIKKYSRRFPHAFRGILYAATKDFGFRTQLYLGGFIAILIVFSFKSLSSTEFLFIALSYVLVLTTELQNSALEAALDRLHPEINDKIKVSKDMAAGAVLMAGLFLLITLVTIVWSHYGHLVFSN